MALTASTIIETAKQRAYGAVGRQNVSESALLAELSYQDMMVVQQISEVAPNLLTTVTGVVTFTDSGNVNGYTLKNGLHYRDFVHVDSADEKYTPISIVGRNKRLSGLRAPCGMIGGAATAGIFYPVDPLGKDWSGSDSRTYFEPDENHSMSYSYVPQPSQLTSTSDTLQSPDMAREVMNTAVTLAVLLQNPEMNEHVQVRIQVETARYTAALDRLMWTAMKFAAPQGQPGGVTSRTGHDAHLLDQIGS